jgi:uncharacterized membrane protein
MSHLRQVWYDVRSSFWFLPALLLAGAIALALLLIEVDTRLAPDVFARWPRLFGTGADGARGLLGVVAGSMISVAGVVFSITLVALSLASSQYTSRVLRHFMRDRANQSVLGIFVGIFAYCLVVLRTIRGGDEGGFVPALAVLVGLLLGLVGIAVLVFFIHHISASIQASQILATVAEETLAVLDRLYPADAGAAVDDDDTLPAATSSNSTSTRCWRWPTSATRSCGCGTASAPSSPRARPSSSCWRRCRPTTTPPRGCVRRSASAARARSTRMPPSASASWSTWR